MGLMEVILSPELDLTNSLLINKPVGRVIFLPLGAVNSTLRSAIVERKQWGIRVEVWGWKRSSRKMEEVGTKGLQVGGRECEATALVKDLNMKREVIRREI